jgi:hypothetical protein
MLRNPAKMSTFRACREQFLRDRSVSRIRLAPTSAKHFSVLLLDCERSNTSERKSLLIALSSTAIPA